MISLFFLLFASLPILCGSAEAKGGHKRLGKGKNSLFKQSHYSRSIQSTAASVNGECLY